MILKFSGIFVLGLVVVESADDSSTDDTITPVSLRDHTYAKPTTVHQRINVQRIVEHVQTSTADPFTPSVPDARRKGVSTDKDLWSWDLWCHLQPKVGNCKENKIQQNKSTTMPSCAFNRCTNHSKRKNKSHGITFHSYYYDTQLDQCVSFTYSGCGGNKNNFRYVDECQRHCNGAAYMAVQDSATSAFCELQPSAGLCMALIPKYYYDINSKKCKEFSYGGCGGNQNRYESIAVCMRHCHNKPSR